MRIVHHRKYEMNDFLYLYVSYGKISIKIRTIRGGITCKGLNSNQVEDCHVCCCLSDLVFLKTVNPFLTEKFRY